MLHVVIINISDTESLYTRIMEKMCAPYKKTFTWDIKMKMMGKKQHEAAKVFIGKYFSQTAISLQKFIIFVFIFAFYTQVFYCLHVIYFVDQRS